MLTSGVFVRRVRTTYGQPLFCTMDELRICVLVAPVPTSNVTVRPAADVSRVRTGYPGSWNPGRSTCDYRYEGADTDRIPKSENRNARSQLSTLDSELSIHTHGLRVCVSPYAPLDRLSAGRRPPTSCFLIPAYQTAVPSASRVSQCPLSTRADWLLASGFWGHSIADDVQ
ncbi:hypothetical protein K466DRAFT_289003 [Polyporus arcularius HHB13444]|uniref:Uncharacterized protein n=1 Tax=Polyporus arcularius HHB13444 TaxID=1314778 RepID=A0A5C3P095_9APHY|nr:hypothetical protein K466DRAFT_289003 [Polyporus arcularius HHB13444]